MMRPEIEELAKTDPIVHTALHGLRAGVWSYEKTLEEMVIALSTDNANYRKQLTTFISKQPPPPFIMQQADFKATELS